MKYSEARFKGSHNSYASARQPITDHLAWDPVQPHEAGCRGLELDLIQDKGAWEWSVAHLGGYDPSPAKQFRKYLDELAVWSRSNPGHDVITVTVDLKNSPGSDDDFAVQFDRYLGAALPAAKLYKPDELQRNENDLVAGAALGWPDVNDLTDRFIFCLSGRKRRKEAYARSGAGRACFADKGFGGSDYIPNKPYGSGQVILNPVRNRVFLNSELGSWTGWVRDMQELASDPVFATRGYTIDHRRWHHAIRARVNNLATDAVFGKSWATVGAAPFTRI